MKACELITLAVCLTILAVLVVLIWCPPVIQVRVISVNVAAEQVMKKAK